ncbi:COG1470 family protein [Archaeoglobus sulfaticallidus]|uniref:COG1470 family protein n=1 Tax=Archaeoglobus sulfaticallidus TaxID=1316941 RepID=UPI00064E7E9B|nr:hypothetical protein [Archaeoglobus sulfaticallidus]
MRTIMYLLILLCLLIFPCSALKVAISGSFYSHHYVIAQGENIKGEDVSVVVFNKMNRSVYINLSYVAPEFIKVNFSTTGYFLKPNEYRKVYIELKADEDAIPGNYTVRVEAIVYETEGNLPVKVVVSAAQEANVTVVGEKAYVEIFALDPVGNVANTALIKLFKGDYEIASAYRKLEKKVTPGNYTAIAYLFDEKVASKSFTLKPDEHKRIEFAIEAVRFEAFDVLPVKDGDRIVQDCVCSITGGD